MLDVTPFYAEMGGQVGDRGTLAAGDDVVEIYDTKRENGMGVHLAKRLPADVEAVFVAAIDRDARMATSCNHTATHLLHEAATRGARNACRAEGLVCVARGAAL